MGSSNSDGFTKYVYTASKQPCGSLKSKTVVQNIYNSPIKLIEKLLYELQLLIKSSDIKEKDIWIEKTILELQSHLKEEKNKEKNKALTQLINKISPP